MSIPRTAIERPVTMFMISAVIVLLGAISLVQLPVDLLPDLTFPSLTVRVAYPGVGPREIEESITRPIEQTVSAVAGLDQLSSTSSEGSSTTRLNFVWGTDLGEAADDLRSRIDRIRGRLPEDADPPVIFKFDSSSWPIMSIAVQGEGDVDPVALREIAERTLSPRLERVNGVAAVTVQGGLRRQIRVDLSKEKITALGLPVDRIVQVLRTENQNIPVGEINEGTLTYLVRSPGQFNNLDEIRNLVVLTREGVPVYMRDIAEVRDGTEDFRQFTRVNGQPGVQMRVTKQSGENTVAISEAVHKEISRINREVPGVTLSVSNDSAVFIEQSIASVREAVMLGSVLVIVIIFVFLRSWRSTLIICTSIPISIIGTFALLFFGGYTLNTMTFGGLALGVGMIVDASIVVLENTQRHLEMGKSRKQASIEGSEEIWSAILASTLTHVAVFVPLFFLTGFSSVLFKQLSVVVVFSLLMSLFVAVTLVPVLCSLLMTEHDEDQERTGIIGWMFRSSGRFLDAMDARYARVLGVALHHRPTVLAVGASLFALAIFLSPYLKFELMPQTDEGEVRVDIELPVGTRVEQTQAAIIEIEDKIRKGVPEAVMLISQGGGGGGFMGGASTHRGEFTIQLKPKAERIRSNEAIAQDLRRLLTGIPGVIARSRASGGSQLNRILGGNQDARLSLEIRGYDFDDAQRLVNESEALLRTVPGIADVRRARQDGRPELAVRVDRDKAAIFGLSVTGVADTLRTNVAGTQAAFYRERGQEYPIVVRLRQEDREHVSDVGDVLVSAPGNRVVPARSLLTVEPGNSPVEIERKNQERISRVNAELEVSLSEAVANVEKRLPELNVPADFSVGFGAELEEQIKAFTQLKYLLILAVILVYAVMASQYESFRDPFIIMFSIPLAAIGVVGALLLTGTTFSLQAYIGVIMLAGIVVSNAILLVDYTSTLRKRDGMELFEAATTAGRTRLRPIIMTTLTTILGLVPMAFEIGEGAELQAPLARVVIGGLLASTMITLVFVPTVYTLFEQGLKGLRRTPAAKKATEPGEAVARVEL
ncbi:Multidrug transporter MdtC [Luteitalea pratensis]|uniref:Multidrug transporter MdtC n=1 Tax=Luteitalea pratensis TaxID=1855912 RepID=A0A143PRR1_LUTPR|nr:efflux RND transporter permease subunit [Luteitalea pratensis]AMY11026.1 Multidrug transporter MdtC [Luteitalea pratensis]